MDVIFLVVWGTLTLVGTVYFALDRNASRKRMLWPVFVLGSFTVFLGLVLFFSLSSGEPTPWDFILFVVVIGGISFYKVRFCDACGATVGLFKRGLFPEHHCPKCGSLLYTWRPQQSRL
jgi:hypothetical protein